MGVVGALISTCSIAISCLDIIGSNLCTTNDDEAGYLCVDDGTDSGGDNIFSGRQLIIRASLVGC